MPTERRTTGFWSWFSSFSTGHGERWPRSQAGENRANRARPGLLGIGSDLRRDCPLQGYRIYRARQRRGNHQLRRWSGYDFKETSLKNHILYVIMYKKVMEELYAKITN